MKNNKLQILDQIDHTLDTLDIILLTITIVGLSYYMLNCYATYYYMNQVSVRPIDATRVEEGLPTDVTLNSNDFTDPADYAAFIEELGLGQDDANNINIVLENSEHYLDIQNQIINANPILRLHAAIENIITTINVEVNAMLNNFYADPNPDLLLSIQELIMRFYVLIEAFILSFFI